MKTQTRKGTQLDPRRQGPAQKTAGAIQTGKDFFPALLTLDSGDEDIRKVQFPVHFYVCYKDLLQARIVYLPDQQLRKFLAKAVSDAL